MASISAGDSVLRMRLGLSALVVAIFLVLHHAQTALYVAGVRLVPVARCFRGSCSRYAWFVVLGGSLVDR